jgi:Holliday junction resolvase
MNYPKGITEDDFLEMMESEPIKISSKYALQDYEIDALDWSTPKPTQQDKFESASKAERMQMKRLFKQMGVTAYTFTDSAGYDRYDGKYTATTTGNEYVFEVKNRNIKSDTYTTAIIDADKVEAVINESKNTKHQPVLFFFYSDKKVMFQPLNESQFYSTIKRNIQRSTMGDQTKKEKTIIEFNITNKKLITLN